VFVVRVWEGEYREELILNITVFVVSVCVVEYREELILNVTVFVVSFGVRSIYRRTDTACYCVCCEFRVEGNKLRN
jgi:hypothetical protein